MTARSYGQFCGIARALDLVGERWALLVVRELVLGPKRFTDLQSELPGIGTNVLSARLRELEQSGVIRRRALLPPAASTVYELTEYGRELEEILLELGRWGLKSMGARRPEQTLRSGWIGLALRAFARPDVAKGIRETYEFRLDDAVFHARTGAGNVLVAGGPAESPDLVVETGNESLLALLAGLLDPSDAVSSGQIRLTGDERLLSRLVEVFRLPAPDVADALFR